MVPRQFEGSRPAPSNRVFAAEVEGLVVVDDVVAGIVCINGIRSRALFDTGASHSFISQSFASMHGMEVKVARMLGGLTLPSSRLVFRRSVWLVQYE